jgi:hypothetical protein
MEFVIVVVVVVVVVIVVTKKYVILPDNMAAQEADTRNFFSIILGMKVATPDSEIPSVTMDNVMNRKHGLLSNDKLVLMKCLSDLPCRVKEGEGEEGARGEWEVWGGWEGWGVR